MINVEINCLKYNIVVGTNSANNPNSIEIYLPYNFLKYKENIKCLKYFNLRGNMFQRKVEIICDKNIFNSTRRNDFLIFEFDNEEEAFYFKMKYT